MIPYMVGKFAPNSTHSTRGLVKYVLGRGYFRAVPSQNGNKFALSTHNRWTNPTIYIFADEGLKTLWLVILFFYILTQKDVHLWLFYFSNGGLFSVLRLWTKGSVRFLLRLTKEKEKGYGKTMGCNEKIYSLYYMCLNKNCVHYYDA